MVARDLLKLQRLCCIILRPLNLCECVLTTWAAGTECAVAMLSRCCPPLSVPKLPLAVLTGCGKFPLTGCSRQSPNTGREHATPQLRAGRRDVARRCIRRERLSRRSVARVRLGNPAYRRDG